MDLDFSTILFIATVFTGGVWYIDRTWGVPKRLEKAARIQESANSEPDDETIQLALKEPTFVEYCKSFFPVILAVFLLRSFLVEPFRIPSGSMMPTLLAGDFILVNKYAYGIRLPVINRKVIDVEDPKRGDVVVFRYPRDPSIDYIKRVVGLPGDHIRYQGKTVSINGKKIAQVPVGTYMGAGAGSSMMGANRRTEQLGDAEHDILVQPNLRSRNGEFFVPPGHYFVMGDNRDNSNDSRFWGTVPNQNLVGKAFLIWMNWDSVDHGINWSRIGDSIR
ncbi:MAG: signal peptidase I [Gammaproteobacteria bacterium]